MTGFVNPEGSVGELAGDPLEVFCSLASLIVEGRVPRPGDARGYGEGPHVPPQPGSTAALVRHKCSKQYLCQQDEKFRKRMLLLWQNNVPVRIEVLLCSDCRVGGQKANSVEYATIPEPGSILVEQWTVSVFNRNPPPPLTNYITSRGLFQAVRSYLHFSQLSAWYSKSGGTEPSNVLFRVTVPGEAFSSKFTSLPEDHYFPHAFVGRMSSVHVNVRSLPRTEKIPVVPCRHNHAKRVVDEGAAAAAPDMNYSEAFVTRCTRDCFQQQKSSSSSELPVHVDQPSSGLPSSCSDQSGGCGSSLDEEEKLPMAGALVWKEIGDRSTVDLRKSLARSRMMANLESVADYKPDVSLCDSLDSTLGDSLLDPPQCLQKIPPKRYQSPSRCGSPSLEAPDHLLFRHFNESRRHEEQTSEGRMARRDLHRRDKNLYGLHPRLLPSGSDLRQRPPTPSSKPAVGSLRDPGGLSVATYRAFPPERNCKAFGSHVYFSKSGGESSARCTISGKHICHAAAAAAANEADERRRLSRMSRWDRHSTQQQQLGSKEQFASESPPSEDLEEARNLGAKRKHKRAPPPPQNVDDDSEEGGIEVAEYVNVPEVGLYPFEDESRQAPLAQKGLEDLLEELSFAKSACSSRRSSAKGDDRAFPHHHGCAGKKKIEKAKRSGILDDLVEPFLPAAISCPPITEVYRAETKLPPPPILSSLSGTKIDDGADGATAKTRERPSGEDVSVSNKLKEASDSERDADNEDDDDDEVCSVLSDEEEIAPARLKGDILQDKSAMKNVLVVDGEQKSEAKTKSLSETLKRTSKRKERESPRRPLADLSFAGSSGVVGAMGSGDEWTGDDDCASPDDDVVVCGDDSSKGSQQKPSREGGNGIPTMTQKDSFLKTLNSATSMVFHRTTGLSLSSSPAPMRKGKRNFDFDSSINKPTDIKRALFHSQSTNSSTNEAWRSIKSKENADSSPGGADGKRVRHPSRKILSPSTPATITSTNLLGSFEESVLNGRLEPVSTVEGFTAEIGASGSFHPKHRTVPVTVFFYTLCDNSNISSPYLGHINLGKKGYRVPSKGTIQVTLFNPLGTVVKMFVVMYDLSDMPPNSQTFLRQRTLYMPTDAGQKDSENSARKWLRYLVHLRFASSKSGKIYLHTDIRMIIFRKSDLDTATDYAPGKGFELRSFTKGPINPKFSPRR